VNGPKQISKSPDKDQFSLQPRLGTVPGKDQPSRTANRNPYKDHVGEPPALMATSIIGFANTTAVAAILN
jgi:hypothetical protein